MDMMIEASIITFTSESMPHVTIRGKYGWHASPFTTLESALSMRTSAPDRLLYTKSLPQSLPVATYSPPATNLISFRKVSLPHKLISTRASTVNSSVVCQTYVNIQVTFLPDCIYSQSSNQHTPIHKAYFCRKGLLHDKVNLQIKEREITDTFARKVSYMTR